MQTHLSHRYPLTQTPSHADTLSRRHPLTQTPSHADTLSCRHPLTQTPSHADTLSHRHRRVFMSLLTGKANVLTAETKYYENNKWKLKIAKLCALCIHRNMWYAVLALLHHKVTSQDAQSQDTLQSDKSLIDILWNTRRKHYYYE